ncbi:PREDICTED: BAG family molecular chaperone regulator 4-like [Tarenaya hassleriana]|uniref:BAG family molecular chaperone regulator 4-like n=1 Tax=Tarenaya hassleriana TaxID=28532 RepID=UPI00053C9BF4|nr:PREDICTED: BAG family molecular chaperone regulator 4-like [Tarenaya hassleriana]
MPVPGKRRTLSHHAEGRREEEDEEQRDLGPIYKRFEESSCSENWKILFRGHEKEDTEQLHTAGVKDSSKVALVEDPGKGEEWVEKQPEVTEEMAKAIAAIAAV